ncbi:MAG: KUP/HAK/KT family potassium transporter, partial [Acidobacteria bacterium]|nr:KUP/HAK/KT family potassium transporter [Acidobacteriota bacterium]
IAVTSTMIVTTILFYIVARNLWKWRMLPTAILCVSFMLIDLAFFGANVIKFFDGGWFPFLLALIIFTLLMTWKKGRSILQSRIQRETQLLEEFLDDLDHKNVLRIPGTAVFMNGNASRTPVALLHNLEHNKVLHKRVLFVTVKTKSVPFISDDERVVM